MPVRVTVRPESSTILYTGDTFAVRETFFVPVHEPGAVIIIEVETAQPLDVEVAFERDFQLEWPAALGRDIRVLGSEAERLLLRRRAEEILRLRWFTDRQPTSRSEYDTNYSSSKENSFHLGVTIKAKTTKIVVIAASTNGQAEAEATYRHLAADYVALAEGVCRLLPRLSG